MRFRTYGWVQNPGDFSKLKLTVQIFDSESTHYQNLRKKLVPDYIYFDEDKSRLLRKLRVNEEIFTYNELVGTSRNKDGKASKKRADAVANSLIQVTILPQSVNTTGKRWTDNWTSDGYLRWAVSLNFVEVNRETDLFSITELGREFSKSENDSMQEKMILQKALLRYPPATQVLNLLNISGNSHTKFYIGEQLGFRGEKGFTSYNEELMLNWLATEKETKERTKIKNDVEGTSDKYARMISGWLEKIGLVEKRSKKIETANGKISSFLEYSITARGKHAIQQANGSSKNNRVQKFIMWEFLAVDAINSDYIRTRRAYILKFLQKTKSLTTLKEQLEVLGFNDDMKIIENDIQGLNYFGLRIWKKGNKVELKDRLNDFSMPNISVTMALKNIEIENKKLALLKRTNLPMKYIELIEIAHDGRNRSRDFEMITADLFKNVYQLKSVLLGGGRKPDGLVFTDEFGMIVDTKAYSEGYGKYIKQADAMIRYIQDNQLRDLERNPTGWWESFSPKIKNDQFYFLWVSSKFVGKFLEQLNYTASQTNTVGGALNVEQLLIGGGKVLSGELDKNDLPNYFNNKEIYFE